MSTMDTSSRMTASHLERISGTAGKHRASAAKSLHRAAGEWFASMPVRSERRFAARPVGAASSVSSPSALKHLQDAAHRSRFAGARAAGQDNQTIACSR